MHLYEHFARALSAHYAPVIRGARTFYRFSNGMSMNKLAEEVTDEGTQLDISDISRYISRERLPTFEQLNGMCTVLELSDDDANLLWVAVIQDIAAKEGYKFEVTMDKRVVDLLLRDVTRLRAALDNDEVERAIEFLRDLREAQLKFSTTDSTPAPIMRPITMMESGRSEVLRKIATRSALEGGAIEIFGLSEAYEIDDLLAGLDMSDEVRRIGKMYFQDGMSAEGIAETEGITTATVYGVVNWIKKKLLQRFAEAGSEDSIE